MGSQIRTVLLLGVAALCAAPFDGIVSRHLDTIHFAGDVKRELETAQQFGGAFSIVLVAVVVSLVYADRRRQLLTALISGAVIFSGVLLVCKMLIGRLRPKFGDPTAILGPWGTHTFEPGAAPVHPWAFWTAHSSDLWSMPSSHTAMAAFLAAYLYRVKPELKPLCIAMVVLVALARLLFISHYLSDILVGAMIGLAFGLWWMRDIGADRRAREHETMAASLEA